MKGRDKISEENTHLIEQNQNLKEVVEELHLILKTKLEKALRKQEQELKGVMNDYLQLITKLLADKEELTNYLEGIEKALASSKAEV